MNIDDFSPCLNCQSRSCGLLDGNECDKCRDFFEIKHAVEEYESEVRRVSALYETIKQHTYVCDICGAVIFPKVTLPGDGRYDVMTSSAEIRGGKGNEVVCGHVCDACVSSMTILPV